MGLRPRRVQRSLGRQADRGRLTGKARPVGSPQQAKLVSHTKFKSIVAVCILKALEIHLFTQIFDSLGALKYLSSAV